MGNVTVFYSCIDPFEVLEPSKLSDNLTVYGLNTGEKIYQINNFTTEDGQCPIISYKITNVSEGISQPSCSGDTSKECKSVVISTEKLAHYYVTFTVIAKGNKTKKSSIIHFYVCKIDKEETYTMNFTLAKSKTKELGTSSILIDIDKFILSEGCG